MIKSFLKNIIYNLIQCIEKFEYRNYDFTDSETNPLKKIINIQEFDDRYDIMSDYGYVPLIEANITAPLELWRLELANGNTLEASGEHIVFTDGHNQSMLKDLTINHKVLCKDNVIHGIGVKSIKKLTNRVSLIDFTVDSNEHSYFTNDILSHNTVSAAIVLLWYALFNKDKGIMIVANKGATVIEIVDKIKGIYKLLPFFLQSGIVNLNQTSIIFENGCRIKTDKRSKEPAIGFTIDLLYLDEFAHIPANIIKPYYTAVVPVVSSVNNSKIIITSTPKGMNLFYELLIAAELSEDDPNWNGFASERIYWNRLKDRMNIKYFPNEVKMKKYGITRKELKDYLISEGFKDVFYKEENNKKGIFIGYDKHDINCNVEYVSTLRYKSVPLQELGAITTWKRQETKLIGGEEAFNQEYDLQFLTGSKLLFDAATIGNIRDDQVDFEYREIENFTKRLPFAYTNLRFIKDRPQLFNAEKKEDYRIVIGVDLGEGLGEDYSILNIFRLVPKTEDEINLKKSKLNDVYDYFKLEQIGYYRSNIHSVKEVAHVLYLIAYEYFNPDNVKIVLERNTYGDTLLAHMPNVFNGDNEYSTHTFVRYKARPDAKNTSMGIKVTKNKNILVKDYQTNTKKGNVVIHDNYTVGQVTTFTKQDTNGGNITFKAESGNDDNIMSVITMCSFFNLVSYKNYVDEFIEFLGDKLSTIIKELIGKVDEEQVSLDVFKTGYNKAYGSKPNQKQVGMPPKRMGGQKPMRGQKPTSIPPNRLGNGMF